MAKAATQGERIVELEQRIGHMESDVHDIKTDVRQIRDALIQGKGSWKIAAALMGLAGTVIFGLIGSWVISTFGPPK